jgi:hypothetical protein
MRIPETESITEIRVSPESRTEKSTWNWIQAQHSKCGERAHSRRVVVGSDSYRWWRSQPDRPAPYEPKSGCPSESSNWSALTGAFTGPLTAYSRRKPRGRARGALARTFWRRKPWKQNDGRCLICICHIGNKISCSLRIRKTKEGIIIRKFYRNMPSITLVIVGSYEQREHEPRLRTLTPKLVVSDWYVEIYNLLFIMYLPPFLTGMFSKTLRRRYLRLRGFVICQEWR